VQQQAAVGADELRPILVGSLRRGDGEQARELDGKGLGYGRVGSGLEWARLAVR
jgi:hypothetical protein